VARTRRARRLGWFGRTAARLRHLGSGRALGSGCGGPAATSWAVRCRHRRRHGRSDLAVDPGTGIVFCSAPRDGTDVPPGPADQNDGGRGEEHQRESLDQWIAAVDDQILDALDLTACEDEVGRGDREEQDERRLNDRGEHAGLPHCENGGDAPSDIAEGKGRSQRLPTRSSVEGKPDRGSRHRQHYSAPPGNSGHIGQR